MSFVSQFRAITPATGPRCPRQVPPARWDCPEHWRRLPKALRDAIWAAYVPGQEVSKTPSARYVVTARLVQEWIAGRIEIRADGSVHPVAPQAQQLTLEVF